MQTHELLPPPKNPFCMPAPAGFAGFGDFGAVAEEAMEAASTFGGAGVRGAASPSMSLVEKSMSISLVETSAWPVAAASPGVGVDAEADAG